VVVVVVVVRRVGRAGRFTCGRGGKATFKSTPTPTSALINPIIGLANAKTTMIPAKNTYIISQYNAQNVINDYYSKLTGQALHVFSSITASVVSKFFNLYIPIEPAIMF
jgi:hypothetical protein